MSRATIYLGTAGWAIPKTAAQHFPAEGSHLARYAGRLRAVEINSTFRQWHQPGTYARWAAAVGEAFRFALKMPQSITHEAGLNNCEGLVRRFVDETAALGHKCGPLLVQLPPALAFSPSTADRFFGFLRRIYSGPAVCEPRHPSWFKPAVECMLVEYRIARVAADPAPVPEADVAGGWQHLAYYRWHGRPRIYYSNYEPGDLNVLAERLIASAETCETWCIFDNTALGFAASNALETARLLDSGGSTP